MTGDKLKEKTVAECTVSVPSPKEKSLIGCFGDGNGDGQEFTSIQHGCNVNECHDNL